MANALTETNRVDVPWSQSLAIAAMLTLTLLMGWLLLAGVITPDQGFLWLGVWCAWPVAWYCYGYLRIHDQVQSNGLLLSMIGWVIVSLGFLVHYILLLDGDSDVPVSQTPNTALVILLLLGIFALVAGGLISWQAVPKSHTAETETDL